MNKKEKKIILFYLFITILILIGVSYSYFTSRQTSNNNQEVIMQTGTLSLVFRGDSSSSNIVSGSLLLGENIERKFSIQNNGNVDAYAKINWHNIVNDYLEGSLVFDLAYSTTENGTYTNIVSNQNVPRSASQSTIELRDGLLIPAGITYYYNLTIKFVETGVDQTSDLGHSLNTGFSLSNGMPLAEKTLRTLNLTLTNGIPNFNNTSCSSGCNEATVGLYKFEDGDDYGDTYYFRGDVTNNYVKFGKWSSHSKNNGTTTKYYYSLEECNADTGQTGTCTEINSGKAGLDMYWRIIRINGDGSLRMIYDGTQAYTNGTSNSNRFVLTSLEWNSYYLENKYIGYMFGNNGSAYRQTNINANDYKNSTNAVYNEKDSTIKTRIDNWYEQNLANGYSEYISDEIFCNDRSTPNTSYALGYGTNTTYYGAYERLARAKTPKLKCTLENDAFTVGLSNSSLVGVDDDDGFGNGMLKYPVGLITADEVAIAGGKWYTNNQKYYLYKGSKYWAFSPSWYYDRYGQNAYGLCVGSGGDFFYEHVNNINAIAPVVNLSPSTVNELIGNGTIGNEFRLE